MKLVWNVGLVSMDVCLKISSGVIPGEDLVFFISLARSRRFVLRNVRGITFGEVEISCCGKKLTVQATTFLL